MLSDHAKIIQFLRLFFEMIPLFMLPISLVFIRFIGDKEWKNNGETVII